MIRKTMPMSFLLSIFLFLFIMSQTAIAEVNLLKDPSFEANMPCWGKGGNAAYIGRYNWHAHEGDWSFGIGNDKGVAAASGEIFQEIELEQLAVSPEGIFLFTIWMMAENNYSGDASLRLEFLDFNRKLLKSYQSPTLKGASAWKKEMVSGVAPREANFIRVSCVSENMSTGAGNSFVWFDDGRLEKVDLRASSSLSSLYAPENILQKKGSWHSDYSNNQWFEINFGQIRKSSGLYICWGKDYARVYEIAISNDGKQWNTIYIETDGKGGEETIYFEQAEAQSIKIIFKTSATERGYEMEQVEIKEPNEAVTLKDYHRMVAQEFPDYYPRWLTKKQAYWTIVGLPGDTRKALFCEDGTIEPHKRGFIIMPFLYLDRKLITRNEAEITQSLEKNYLPIPSVKWDCKGVTMEIRLFGYGDLQASSAYARYSVRNNRQEEIDGKLFLTIRPFQVYPFWQEGTDSFAPIHSINYKGDIVNIDGKYKICSLTKPSEFGTKSGNIKFPFKIPPTSELEADIVSDIKNGSLPESDDIEDAEGFASAAIEYRFKLKPGASEDFFVAIPLYDKAPDLNSTMSTVNIKEGFEKMLKKTITFWEDKVNRVEINIPETDIVNTLKSYIAYNLITKDGPTLQPGSRSYDKGWMRDGSIQATALLEMGLTSEVKDFINWMAGFQFETGEIPPVIDNKAKDPLWEEKEKGLKEYDSQGEFIWVVLQYYHFTKDKEFLKDKLPKVVKALEFLAYLRSQTLTQEYKDEKSEKRAYYGILPQSRSHEGYWLAYSYWDDFWALKGWKDARTIAAILERDDLINWINWEYSDFKKSVYESIKRVMEAKKIDYIPGAAELGDFDATSTAVAVVYCEELKNLPQPQLNNTFDKYYKNLSGRFKPDSEYRFTPYELRSAPALLYMGEKEKSLELLRFMLKCRRPLAWNHLAEVVHSDYRFPTYIGDMPHTWVGAEYINAVRSLFVYELNDKLILGHGIDEQWLSREEGISIKNMPTYYGNINYTIKKDETSLNLKIWGGNVTTPPNGFVFKLPHLGEIKEVSLNGEKLKGFSDEEIIFYKLPVEIVAHF